MTTETMVVCLRCNGRTDGVAIVCGPNGSQLRPSTCDFCKGVREVTQDRAMALRERDAVRKDRIANGTTMAYMAYWRNMTIPEYSAWERGKDI